MKLPDIPDTGATYIPRAWFKDLRAYLQAITPQRGGHIYPETRPGGTTFWSRIQAGSSSSTELKPFELVLTNHPDSPSTKVIRIVSSTLAGGSAADLGFNLGDDPISFFSPMAGVVQGGIQIDPSDGSIIDRWLDLVEELGENTATIFYVEIGTVGGDAEAGWTVSNSRYGPIDATICRNWFAAEEPFYGVTFTSGVPEYEY